MTKALLSCSLLFLFFAACKEDEISLQEVQKIYKAKQERGEDVTILYSENGYTKAKLFAHSFFQKRDITPPFVEMKDGLRVDFYDDKTTISSTLTAKYGRYYESKGNVLVKDSVVVTNAKKETLETEELVWNEKLGKFYSDKQVKVSTPTQVIFGDGLEANEDFSNYTITKVKGVISVDKDRVPQLD